MKTKRRSVGRSYMKSELLLKAPELSRRHQSLIFHSKASTKPSTPNFAASLIIPVLGNKIGPANLITKGKLYQSQSKWQAPVGGKSIYGAKFPDEVPGLKLKPTYHHSRGIKFKSMFCQIKLI